jgi:hypothetical protein
MKNPNKFYLFHRDNKHDTKGCHVLKNIERLIATGYLHQFMRKEK